MCVMDLSDLIWWDISRVILFHMTSTDTRPCRDNEQLVVNFDICLPISISVSV